MIFIFIHACNKISAYVINIQAKASNFIPAVREAIAKECQRHMQESFGALQNKISCEQVLSTEVREASLSKSC